MKRLVGVLVALVATACGGSGDAEEEMWYLPGLPHRRLRRGGVAFEEANRGTDVVLTWGDSALRERILEGAPADVVFASANTSNMDQVVEGGENAGEPEIFVTILPISRSRRATTRGFTGLADFANEELVIGPPRRSPTANSVGRPGPCRSDPIDHERTGCARPAGQVEAEVDAGIVYLTDVISTDGAVEGIDIPEEENVLAEYPVAALSGAPSSDRPPRLSSSSCPTRGNRSSQFSSGTVNRAAARRRRVEGAALLVVLGALSSPVCRARCRPGAAYPLVAAARAPCRGCGG